MEVQYTATAKAYHGNYVKNARAVTAMWILFSACFLIIAIVIFAQPQWVGDTKDSRGDGYFGLYRFCVRNQDGADMLCGGRFGDFSSILSSAFKAATFFVGFCILLMIICLICMCLFCCVRAYKVLYLCGSVQILAAICLFLALVIYPAGYGHLRIQRVCGIFASPYNLDGCSMRWAYVLGIVGLCDIVALAVLAFVLGSRQARLKPTSSTEKLSSAYSAASTLPKNGTIKVVSSAPPPPLSIENGTILHNGSLQPAIVVPEPGMPLSNEHYLTLQPAPRPMRIDSNTIARSPRPRSDFTL